MKAVYIIPFALLLGACSTQQAEPEKAIGMANPAAKYCIDLGGQYQIVDTKDGQAGKCLYQGQNWDAWELYRNHHTDK